MTFRAGDIVWIDLDPVRGTEQAGRRPGLVVSEEILHSVSKRSVICPITTRIRGWSTEVRLPASLATKGAVLVDQVRSIDRDQRAFGFIEHVPAEVLAQVRGRLAEILGITPLFTT